MDVKNTHSVTKTEISVFGRQALDAERRRSPSLAGKVLINSSQHGFLKAKSCLTNVLCFLEEITKWVDDGSPVEIIFRFSESIS